MRALTSIPATALLTAALAASALAKAPATPTLVEQRVAEARRWTQGGFSAHALDAWRRVLDLAPNHGEAWVQVGVLHANAGEMLEAESVLAQAQRVKPAPAGLKTLSSALAAAKARGGAPLASANPAGAAVRAADAGSAAGAALPATAASAADAARPTASGPSFPPPPPLPLDPWASAAATLIPPPGGSVPAPATAPLGGTGSSLPASPPGAAPQLTQASSAARSASAASAPRPAASFGGAPSAASSIALGKTPATVAPQVNALPAAPTASAASAPKLSRKERLRLERDRKAAERKAAREAKLEKQRATVAAKKSASSAAKSASAPVAAAPLPTASAASAPKALVLPPPTPLPSSPWATPGVPIPATGPAMQPLPSGGASVLQSGMAAPVRPVTPAFTVPPGDPTPLLAELRTPSAMIERWADTRLKLEALADAHPQNAQVLGALAGHLAMREGTRREAVRQYESLSARNMGTADTREAWRQALMSLTPRPGDDLLYVAYLTRYPDDLRVAEHLRVLHGAGIPAGADLSRTTRP